MKDIQNNFRNIIYLAIAGGFLIGFVFGFAAATIVILKTF